MSLQGLPALLQRTLEHLNKLGSEFAADSQKVKALLERFLEERFHLAVLGQFKRGKSTLLNALLGEELLPTSVVPLTAIPTFILWGPELRARVHYQDGRPGDEFPTRHDKTAYDGTEHDKTRNGPILASFLSQFVAESGNPKNCKGVSHVEVFHPSPLLHNGVVLIDTPGIGSTFRHNTEATLNFLPQCDAALFVVSADPPITEVEVDFLKAVRPRVARLFFIVNKVDYLSEEEKGALLHFVGNVLREQVGIKEESPIFCVSARQGLEARQSADVALWKRSGLEEVRSHLIDFLARDKTSALREALANKAWEMIADVLMRLRITIRSLQMPLTELDERLQIFEKELQEAGRQQIVMRDLLAGDRKRTVEFLEEQAEHLRQKARVYLKGTVWESLARIDAAFDENRVQEDLADAIPRFFEHELGEMAHAFDLRVSEVLLPHQQRADELIETVRKTAAELFKVPYHALESSGAFQMNRQPYWVTHPWNSTLNPLPVGWAARLLPAGLRRARLEKRLMKQVEELVLFNVENLRWATLQNLDQAFRSFGSTLDEHLQAAIAATHGAIQAAQAKRRDQTPTIAPEIARLQSAIVELENIQAALQAKTRAAV
ncbi:MAG: dynamin family protein [Firmicutes bacterium]|nr:dynamin family protein [Bacillota bacterium]